MTNRSFQPRPARKLPALPTLNVGAIVIGETTGNGLQLGIEEAQHASKMLDSAVTLITEKMSSSADSIVEAAMRVKARENISAIVGGGNDAQCVELSEWCAAHEILYFNTVSAVDSLRQAHCNSHTFHVQPSERMFMDAIATGVLPQSNPSSDSSSQLATVRAVSWHFSLNRYGADTLNTRFRTRFGEGMSERAWADWFAVKVLWETFLRARTIDASALAHMLTASTARFDGHKGRQLSFRTWDHQLRQPLYVLRNSSALGVAVIEVPATGNPDESTQQALDTLGSSASETSCLLPS